MPQKPKHNLQKLFSTRMAALSPALTVRIQHFL
jgi:hypothetical protein